MCFDVELRRTAEWHEDGGVLGDRFAGMESSSLARCLLWVLRGDATAPLSVGVIAVKYLKIFVVFFMRGRQATVHKQECVKKTN